MKPELELDLAFADEMALSQKDKDWIIEQHSAAHDVAGWHRFTRWLKDWGVLGTAIAGAITLLGLTLGAVYFGVAEMRNNSEFRGQTKARLDSIEASLRTLRASQSPQKVLHEIAALPQSQFSQNLPALQRIVEQPTDEVRPSESILRTVAFKLRNADESIPQYWSTVLRFLDRRS